MKAASFAVLAVTAVAGGAGSALGALTEFNGPFVESETRIVMNRDGARRVEPVGFGLRGGPITDVYDSLGTIVAAAANANLFLGDNLITTGTGDVREFEFTLFNGSTNAAWTRSDISVLFLEFDGVSTYNVIDQLNFNDVPIGLAAGAFTTFLLEDPGITITNTDIVAAVRFTDVQGIAANQAAQLRTNPVLIGSSANTFHFRENGAPGAFAFVGFASNNNFAYRVAVPAPGALALLGLGGLAAIRRRR